MLTRLLAILVLLLAGFETFAQQLVFENVGVKQGLPASELYSLYQDQKGYVWVFTEYGIVKYNGSSFVPVCQNISIRESAIYAYVESSDGTLYVMNSLAKLYRIHNDKAYLVHGVEKVTDFMQLDGQDVTDLEFTAKGNLRITTFVQSFHVPVKRLSVKGLPKNMPKPKKSDRLQVLKHDFQRYAKSKYLMTILKDNGERYPIQYQKLINHSRICSFELSGSLCVSMNSDVLVKYPDGRVKSINLGANILRMKKDAKNHIWVGLNGGGLIELDSRLNVLNHYFGTTLVSDIFFDDQSGMWVSTVGKGLYHCDNITKQSYSNYPELTGEVCLIQKANRKLFIGTLGGDVFVQENKTLRKLDLPKGLLGINTVFYFNNRYFIGCKGEQFLTLREDFTLEHSTKAMVFGIARYNDHQLLITEPGGISKYDVAKHQIDLVVYNGKNRLMVTRNPGEYFTATKRGVCRIKDDEGSFPEYLKPLIGKNISRIVPDERKNLWFCTKGDGVYCLNLKNKLLHYTDFPVKIVSNFAFTKDGLIFLSTNNGAFVTAVDDMNDKRSWRRVLNEETLVIEEYRGQLFIGTKKGLTVIDKAKLITNNNYRFHLISLKAKQNKIALTNNTISLNYDQNDLYFDYDFLDFQDHSNWLNYKLKGPYSTSGVVSGDQIRLQNLEPGQYKLEVYPEMNFADGRSLTNTITFTIHPAFWQTGWFFVLCILALLGIIVTGVLVVIRRNIRKRRAKDEIERVLTEYRLTALKAQVNPHFMSNSLVAIQHLILESETDKANLYIAKFSLLIRSLLDYSNKPAATLKAEIGMIELYVELEQLRFSNQFVFQLNIDPSLDLEDVFVPALITQPFVENAIWHGLLPLKKTRNPRLILNVSASTEGVIISIIDNGVGRKEKSTNTERESKGTQLIVQRLESLNQLYQTTGGKIEFIDLKDTDGNASGTQVNIVIPKEILNELYHGKN